MFFHIMLCAGMTSGACRGWGQGGHHGGLGWGGGQNQSKLGALRTPPTPITKHTYTPLDDILVRILSSSVQ